MAYHFPISQKLSLRIAGLGLLGVFGVVALWQPDFLIDRSSDSSATSLVLSDRSIDASSLTKIAEGEGDQLTVKKGESTPRVSRADKVSLKGQVTSTDAPDDETFESVIVAKQKAQKENKISGIRRRLLLEAAGRALHSETPWSDLSLVALGFKRAGDDEAARYWFERASRLALDPDDALLGSRAMREVVKNMVSGGYFDLAKDLISRIPLDNEKSRARAELVRAYARKRNFDEARRIAADLGDPKSRGIALRSIAEGEARYVDLPSALMTLGQIPAGERDVSFHKVATIRASMGDLDGAMSLVSQISDQRRRDVALTRIAGIQARGGAVSIKSLVSLIHDSSFRDQALLGLIEAEAARRGIETAATAVNQIRTATERAKAYESLVQFQLRHRDLDGALARAQSIGLDDSRARALQSVAVATVREQGSKAARNVANLIGDEDVREATFSKIAQRSAQVGQNRGAVDTIQYIEDPSERAMAYANVALTRARFGADREARVLIEGANRELSQIESPRQQARAQTIVAQAFAETGDSNSALTTAAAIENSGLRDVTYQRLAVSFAKSHDADTAEQSAQLIEREVTRERALDSVASTLARSVSFTDAFSYAARLGGHRQQVRFLLGVAGRKS